MEPAKPTDLTVLLNRMASGDSAAADALMPLLYEQLHSLAEGMMRDQGPRHTLQPTALVHEAWMRLTGGEFVSREHFAAVSAKAMRSVLVDHARRRNADKRGGAQARKPLDQVYELFQDGGPDLLDLEDALKRLGENDPALARIVELRYFGGLTVEEIAKVQGSSTATVTRAWRFARQWLARELDGAEE
jgi:RNA polymerase sigma factor (TIGR02999 family)